MFDRELKALLAVAPRTIECATFIFVDEVESGEKKSLPDWSPFGVYLDYEGPAKGSLHLWAEPAFLMTLSANMLGVEVDSAQAGEKAQDAFKELLNMTMGAFLTEAFGTLPVINLSIPELLDASELDADLKVVEKVWIMAEGHQLLFVHLRA